ncbi:MAG: class I SAM-dependent methyltransferase, partial [Candidatus Pacearchaeota archaeon]
MRYYKEILEEKLKVVSDNLHKEKYHYHVWTSKSIEKFWQIHTNSLIKEQFYPIDYWIDLINWANKMIKHCNIDKILDIGCGIGNLIDVLIKYYPNSKIIGMDLSDESLKTAKNRFRNFNNIEFKVGRISDIPIENESIDLVTCTEV